MIRLQLKKFTLLTRLEQTLFGLPMLFSAYLLIDQETTFLKFFLLLGAFISARITGISFNQWLDLRFDKLNPRTQNRPLVTQLISVKEAKMISFMSLLIFLSLCLSFNMKTFFLGSIASILITGYSLTKRFTILCHFVLGLIHALHPWMLSVALQEYISTPILILGSFAFCFISANDILYALQDRLFDESKGLYSIPAFLGHKNSLKLTLLLHSIALILIFILGVYLQQKLLFTLLIVCISLILVPLYIKQHEKAFFRTTASIPLMLLITIVIQSLIK